MFRVVHDTVCHIWAVMSKILYSQIVCGSSLFRQQAKPPKTSSVLPKHHFSSGRLTRRSAAVCVCNVSVCDFWQRKCVLCGYVSHRSALRQLIRLRWQTVMEGGERAALTPDQWHTVPRSQSLLIRSGWTAGDKDTHTHTHVSAGLELVLRH